MLGISAHVNWSNLPLRPIFLPLVTRLTFELAEVRHGFHNVIAGQPLVLAFPEATRPVGIELVLPSGETLRLKSDGTEGKAGQTFRYADTHAIGVYLLRALGTTRSEQNSYAVNCGSRRGRSGRKSSGRNCKSVSAASRWCSPRIPTISPAPLPCSARARACGACSSRWCWSAWCSRRFFPTG